MRGLILKIGIVILVVATFFLLNFSFLSKKIKNFFFSISEPFQNRFWQTGARLSDFLEMISEIKNLKKEAEQKEKKIQELLIENISLRELKKENTILREALGLGLEKEFELKTAQVIGKEIFKDSLIINKGFDDGLMVGLPVITQQKVLVGKISETYANFSRIQLLTSQESSFDVESQREVYGLARGKGNLKLSIERILKEKEIEVGDKILTSALGGNFPKGLLVGEISKIKKIDVEPFQEAEVKISLDLNELDFLFAITNFKNFKE